VSGRGNGSETPGLATHWCGS